MTRSDTALAAAEDTPRPLRKDAARNRALLLAAARKVFADRGFEASLDEVAHRAGVGVGTAYRHFANKHDLAQAVFADAIDEMVGLAEDALSASDPWQGIVGFLEAAAAKQACDRGLREVLMGVHDSRQVDAFNDRIGTALETLVSRAKAAGEIRDDVEVTDFGVVVLMLCTVADATGDVRPDQWRRYLPMLVNALRAGPESDIPPMSEQDFRAALSGYKLRLSRFPATH